MLSRRIILRSFLVLVLLAMLCLRCGGGLFPSEVNNVINSLRFGGIASITDIEADSLRVTWTPVDAAAGYRVYRVSGSEAINVGEVSDGTASSHTVLGLSPSTQYLLRVNALDSVSSRDANEVTLSATTLASGTLSGNIPTSSLAFWLKAGAGVTLEDTRVSQWADQSGGSHVFTQSASVKRPYWVSVAVNDRPAVVFNLPGLWLENVGLLWGGTPFTFFAVYIPVNLANSGGGLFQHSGSGGVGFGFSQAQYLAVCSFTGTCTQSDLSVTGYVWQIATFRGAGFSQGSGSARVWRNSLQSATDLSNSVTPTATSIIGEYAGTTFRGSIAEILLYSTELSDADRVQVEAYLAERYTILLER